MLFVEKAFDENRVLQRPKELSINKVGHGKVTNLYPLSRNCLPFLVGLVEDPTLQTCSLLN